MIVFLRGCQLALLAALLLCAPVASAQSSDAAEEMAELLAGWESISLVFTQSTYNASRRLVSKRKGRIWIKKPRRFRLHIDKPDEEVSVSDGTNFWIYDPLLKQVQQGILEDRWETAPLLLISDDPRQLEDSWNIEVSGRKGRREFVLRPKSEEILFQKISLKLRNSIPSQMQIVDSTDQLLQLNFRNAQANQPIDDEVFTFIPPADADVLIDE